MRLHLFACALLLSATSLKAQTTLTDSIVSGGITRYYQLYIPAAYDGTEAWPLVLNLHGYGSYAFQQIFYGEFRPIADTAHFFILLPDGTTDVFGFQFWNTFATFGTGVDDVSFINDLLDSISADYEVDQNRIYSTGMSNGGFMSYELACQLPQRIAAIASVTGSIDEDHFDFCDPLNPVPVMSIHGTADATVPYDGNADFLSVDAVLDYWVAHNNCNPEAAITDIPDISPGDGSTVQKLVFDGGTNGTTVEHFKVINGGHTWPGTILLLPGAGSTNKDIQASTEIWRFFSRYRLDELSSFNQVAASRDDFWVYPNPGNGIFYFNEVQISNPLVQLYNLQGSLVYEGFEHQGFVDVSHLENGVYLLKTFAGVTTYILQQ